MDRRLGWRVVAGAAAAAMLGGALYVAADLFDVLTRPVNAGWIEVLLILFLPHFLAVGLLTAVGALLARYARAGSMSSVKKR
jgi:hypothetical protein